MIVKNKYFSLCRDKIFHNGEKKIFQNEKILYLCTNKDSNRFLYDKDDCMIVFWLKDSEAKFLEEIEEEVDVENYKIIENIKKDKFITA